MSVLKLALYIVVGIIAVALLFFFAELGFTVCEIVGRKLKKIIKKNKYVDKTVGIAINIFAIILLLIALCSMGMYVCAFIGL